MLFLIVGVASTLAQTDSGELHLKVTTPGGAGLQSSVELVSEANHYRQSFLTDNAGLLEVKHLPFGLYYVEVGHPALASASRVVEIRSSVPTVQLVQLGFASVETTVQVKESDTLLNPSRQGTSNHIDSETIAERSTSLPGRSLQELVNLQPGWLFEGNAVLHPRGSEYQTQFVVDGIPLTDNRSPGHGAEIGADDVASLSVFASAIPAEFGRKMGGIVEVTTARDARAGFHGEIALSVASFDTGGAHSMVQYLSGKNTFAIAVNGAITDRYLSPPVPQNFTNAGSTGGFSGSYERDFSPSDRLSAQFRDQQVHFEVPNEQVQQTAGQRQDGAISEYLGIVSYQHLFSSNVLCNLGGMVRYDSHSLSSNVASTPIVAFQRDHSTEGYFKASVSIHSKQQEWKVGAESDNTFLSERFADFITDASEFDPGTPRTFRFAGSRLDLEQSAFVQDLIRLGNWTVSAGIRWDHYQLIVNQNALSPRLGVARYFARSDVVIHAAYDRVFQTPSFENILLSSSPEVVALNPNVLRLPVEPSRGDYFEVGLTKGLLGKLSLGVNAYFREVNNFADDDLLLNTPVSFPIAFRNGEIYGAEGKMSIPQWGRLSGFVSYSYMVGSAYFPVTGGLFLGQSATNALTQLAGRFWVSQDQRNTVRLRFRYQFLPRLWCAFGAEYGSGLPVDFDGTFEQALAEYGHAVIDRVNFIRGRVRPSLSVDASLGVNLWKKDTAGLRVQFDAQNLNNRLNLINFAGLFSGNAIAPPRSYALRLTGFF